MFFNNVLNLLEILYLYSLIGEKKRLTLKAIHKISRLGPNTQWIESKNKTIFFILGHSYIVPGIFCQGNIILSGDQNAGNCSKSF